MHLIGPGISYSYACAFINMSVSVAYKFNMEISVNKALLEAAKRLAGAIQSDAQSTNDSDGDDGDGDSVLRHYLNPLPEGALA